MLLFTDPQRTPDPAASAERLPRGAGVVYRAFGAADAVESGRALARVCRRRGLILFVGADPSLAARLGADGLHLPEREAFRPGYVRRLRARFRVTASAHSLAAVRRALAAGAEAIVVSPVFQSRSPSAGRPLGLFALATLVRQADATVYALGGVNARTALGLRMTGVAGLAAIEALA